MPAASSIDGRPLEWCPVASYRQLSLAREECLMSTDPKPPKPMPSAAEINAYLEQSAARTRMRLPLAKGAAAVVVPPPLAPLPPVVKVNERALPVQGAKKLPTQQPAAVSPAAPGAVGGEPGAARADDGAWRP